MPHLLHMSAAAPASITSYDTDAFGPDFRGNLFGAYFNLRKVSRHPLTVRGATLATEDRDFVVADSGDFHPTDVEVDADGSLLILDTGGWYKLCCPTSQLAKPDIIGAIYRVRKTGAVRIEDPRGLRLEWAQAGTPELVARLGDARFAVRDHALQALVRRGTDAVEPLRAAQGAEARLHAVWAATRIAAPAARAFVREAMRDSEDTVRQAALNSVSVWRDREAVPQLLTMLDQRVALEALGRIGDPRAVPALLAAAKPPAGEVAASGAPADDAARIRDHALIYALIEIGDIAAIAQGLDATEPAVRRAALVALDQLKSPALTPQHMIPLLAGGDGVLKRTATWIVSHRADWGTALAAHFRAQLAQPTPTAELPALLAQLAKSADIQELLAATLRDNPSASARRAALTAMGGAGLKVTPPSWLDALATLISQADLEILEPAVATAQRLPLAKGGHAGLATALSAAGRKEALPTQLRLSALAASATPGALDDRLFDLLLTVLPPGQALPLRSAATEILSRAPLTADQRLKLADSLKSTGPLETPRLLPAFASPGTEALGLRLIAALKESPGLQGVRSSQLQPLLAKYPPAVREAGAGLLDRVNADAAQILARVTALSATLPPGDVRRGQALFNSAKSTCTACHAIGYAGGKFGPDLTRIGQARSTRDLLEAIVAPSASFVQGYEPFTVTTRDGVQHFGLLRKNSPDEVLLATGPGTEERLSRADVTEMRPGSVSLMPQGYDQLLTPQDLADLIAFLDPKK
jgi:putative heme-binding domain-containing protein